MSVSLVRIDTTHIRTADDSTNSPLQLHHNFSYFYSYSNKQEDLLCFKEMKRKIVYTNEDWKRVTIMSGDLTRYHTT